MQKYPTFVLTKSDFKQYALTLRKTKVQKTKKEVFSDAELREIYQNRLSEFTEAGIKIMEYTYEATAGLHLHALVEIPKSYQLIKLRRRGWSIKIDEIYNKEGWLKYINKDQNMTPSEEQEYIEWSNSIALCEGEKYLPMASKVGEDDDSAASEASDDQPMDPTILNKKIFKTYSKSNAHEIVQTNLPKKTEINETNPQIKSI